MKKNVPLLVAGIVGLLAVGLVYMYLNRMRQEVYKGMDMVHVLVAADDLQAGTRISSANVAGRGFPQKYVGNRAVSVNDAEIIINALLVNNVQKGQPLFWSDIEAARQLESGVAGIIERGMRAVTIPVTEITGLAGMLQPNHRVDVLFTFDPALFDSHEQQKRQTPDVPQTMEELRQNFLVQMHSQLGTPGKAHMATVFENVLVLATGKQFPEGSMMPAVAGGLEDKYSSITLMLPTEHARMLTYIMDQGKISLLLRNPLDVTIVSRRETITPADFNEFMSMTNRMEQTTIKAR